MVARNYLGALALSALLGCSVQKSDSYPIKDVRGEKLFLEGHGTLDSFRGRRVVVTYKTNDGPGSSYPLRPVDVSFVEGVQRELAVRKAYTLPVGNPTGNYTDINLLFSQRSGLSPDSVVIADSGASLSGIKADLLDRVYTVSFKDGSYNFERAIK
jgi:hypothetical protein